MAAAAARSYFLKYRPGNRCVGVFAKFDLAADCISKHSPFEQWRLIRTAEQPEPLFVFEENRPLASARRIVLTRHLHKIKTTLWTARALPWKEPQTPLRLPDRKGIPSMRAQASFGGAPIRKSSIGIRKSNVAHPSGVEPETF